MPEYNEQALQLENGGFEASFRRKFVAHMRLGDYREVLISSEFKRAFHFLFRP